MAIEMVERNGSTYGIIVRAKDMKTDQTKFYTSNESQLQVGVISHPVGYEERPHYHRKTKRHHEGTHETVTILKGKLAVDFLDEKGKPFKTVELTKGDLAIIMDGYHRIRVLEDYAGLMVKTGPYVSVEEDKVFIDGK